MKRAFLFLLLLVVFARSSFAHEVRPAYLELRQTAAETYDGLWKVPVSANLHGTLRGTSGGLHKRQRAARVDAPTPTPNVGRRSAQVG
jgi:hypothetical protein